MKHLRWMIVMGAVLATLCTPLAAEDKVEFKTGQHAYSFEHDGMKTDFLVYVPKTAKAGKAMPLLLFLHGAGERGSNIEAVKKHGPPKLAGKMKELDQFIVVSPQCPEKMWWAGSTLDALLKHVAKHTKIDERRVYLTGLSMGGFGTWSLGARYPDRFAALVPICGGGNPADAGKIKDVPIWVFHGDKDTAVPIERSQVMVDALKATGAKPKFTIYEGVGHDSWTQTYSKPELYKWLLEHKLQKDSKQAAAGATGAGE